MNNTEPRENQDHTSDFAWNCTSEWNWASGSPDWVPPAVNPAKVSAARIYDYLLGGKNNFAVDRSAAEKVLSVAPYSKAMALENRRFLHRAVRYLVRDCGIRQLVDLGTGIPTSPSVHEVAQTLAPGVQVVYVDNDPVVAAHNRAVLATDPGTITLLRDLREPDTILDDPAVRNLIDFDQPVGLLFVAVLHFVALEQAPALLARYREVLAPGSGVAISALCREHSDPAALQIAEAMYENSESTLYSRSTAQVRELFEGLRLPLPLVPVTEWGRTANDPPAADIPVSGLAGIGLRDSTKAAL
jgi:hypothetical protein